MADPTTRTVAEIATEHGFWELLDAVDRSDLAFIAALFLIVSAVLVVVYAVTFALMWLL